MQTKLGFGTAAPRFTLPVKVCKRTQAMIRSPEQKVVFREECLNLTAETAACSARPSIAFPVKKTTVFKLSDSLTKKKRNFTMFRD